VLLKLRSSALTGTALALILAALPGCDISPGKTDQFTTLPPKLQDQVELDKTGALIEGTGKEHRVAPKIEPGPAPPPPLSASATSAKQLPALTGQVASVSVEQMPIPAFINTILGETLHLTFEIDPKVSAKTDLVTMRTGGPESAQELLSNTREVLRNYGIQLSYDKDIIRARLSESLATEMPQIILGRTSPDIAESLRPVFQVLVLDHVNNQDMASWLSTAFGTKIKFIPSPSNNSIILLGLPDDVRAASEGIRLLDQPRLAGRPSLKIVPVFWTAAALAEKLGDVLRAEGYNVSSAPVPPAAVTLLPLPTIDTVLAFASDQKILDHVAKWAHDLDQPAQVDPRQSVFYYPVRNTTADSLVKVLNAVLGTESASPTAADLQQPGLLSRTAGAKPADPAAKPLSGNTRFVVDTVRNSLIFLGSAEAYAQVRPLIVSLDEAPREVLIEVTIAEVTLSDSQSLGLEWSKIANIGGGNTLGVAGGAAGSTSTSPFTSTTTSGIGAATTTGFNGGLLLQVLNAKNAVGQTLQALQATSHTKIVSTPRLLARSGATAKFQVGQDVPIVTSQVTSSSFVPGSGLQQSVSYRSTGTLIQVKPVIYAGNQIDLDISQEQSAPVGGGAAGESPPINDQNVSTQLSLSDGATVLLGGFISESKGDDDTGIPYLKDIPGLGLLFRNSDANVSRNETLIFITPYIINSGLDSQRITDSVREGLKQLPEIRQTTIY
jgi:general secretion pathway protein D